MSNFIQLFKTIHVVGFVSWFAGLFYLWRMFVYYAEAMHKAEPAKSILLTEYGLMQKRVYKIICNPAMMITWAFGLGMLFVNPEYLSQSWIHFKLLFLVALTIFHLYSKRFMLQQQSGKMEIDPFKLRLLNEVPTLLLIIIVSFAVFRQNINLIYLLIFLILFSLMLVAGAKKYKKMREKNPDL